MRCMADRTEEGGKAVCGWSDSQLAEPGWLPTSRQVFLSRTSYLLLRISYDIYLFPGQTQLRSESDERFMREALSRRGCGPAR